MEFELKFIFRGQPHYCVAYIDSSEEPCYVFVQLQDKALVDEFGSDVTVKTDFENCLAKKDDFVGDLKSLRQALFDALKDNGYFKGARRYQYI